ncbi:MAG: hypothetical protein JJE25_02045 [Bacteroidia bacterium]|nr:hypothetical protein [Bacteroidia bacterium]
MNVSGQDSSHTRITITGKVFDESQPYQPLFDLMIINQRTGQGFFGKTDGTFKTSIEKDDTLMISSVGYSIYRLCYHDSVIQKSYSIEVALKKLYVQLKEVDIFSPRELEKIQKDIDKLGYNKRDYQLSGVDALQSPITFLYQEFSKKEQLHRHNLQIVNESKRRNLLKELLQRYAADGIIQLNDDAFDVFIDFARVSEAFLKNSTQYEFMVYIKEKYKLFVAKNDYYRER